MEITGKIINKKYEIKERMAEGGSGYIYKAHDLNNNNSIVAVKILKNSAYPQGDIIRFRTEVDTISGIDYPNIIKIYETGILDNIYEMNN